MADPKRKGLSDRSVAAMAYFTPAPAIFFLAIRRYNKRPFVRYHSWQSVVFGAFVFLFAYFLAFVLPFAQFTNPTMLSVLRWITFLIWALIALAWLWCVIGALNGKNVKLPIIGNWADEQAYR